VSESPQEPRGTVVATKLSRLLAVAIVSGVVGYALVPVFEALTTTAPRVEWPQLLTLAIIAVMLSVLAWTTYKTVHRDRVRMPAERAVTVLMLAKASALVGAVVVGGYFGFGLNFVDRLDVELPRERAIRSLLAALIGVGIVISALLLERACRVPKEPDE